VHSRSSSVEGAGECPPFQWEWSWVELVARKSLNHAVAWALVGFFIESRRRRCDDRNNEGEESEGETHVDITQRWDGQ